MKRARVNYVVVGAFVVAMIVALVGSLAVLMGRTGPTDGYHTVFRNVSGIKFGTQVLFEGYPVGQVEKITPVATDGEIGFRVDFRVQRGWRIPEDSIAAIVSPRLLAAVTIDITAGRSEAALAPGDRVAGRDGADVFAAMAMLAGEVADLTRGSLRPLLATLDEVVGTAGQLLASDGVALTAELRTLAETVNRRAPAILDNVERLTASLNDSGEQLQRLTSPDNRQKIEALIGSLQQTGTNLVALTGRVDRLSASLQGVIDDNRTDIRQSLANLRYVTESVARDIDAINQNLSGTARNMFEFSREIRQNPGALLGGTRPRDDARRP
ncbi:MAG: MlaD family protein [Rhodospirillales bacterium]